MLTAYNILDKSYDATGGFVFPAKDVQRKCSALDH